MGLISETTFSSTPTSLEIQCFMIMLNFVGMGESCDVAHWKSVCGLAKSMTVFDYQNRDLLVAV